jgi:hypothetical protein
MDFDDARRVLEARADDLRGASITLDFDAAASVQVNETGSGTLILRPVVTAKETD